MVDSSIPNAIAWLREMADVHHDVPDAESWLSWADAIEAREAKIERLRRVELAAGNLDRYSLVIDSAVRNDDPGNADGVTAAILRLRDAMNMKQGNATSNPSEDTSSVDRDAAVALTHLPASAPPLGSPAPQTISHAQFAKIASFMASHCARWSADCLTLKEDLDKPMRQESLHRFADRIKGWLETIKGAKQ